MPFSSEFVKTAKEDIFVYKIYKVTSLPLSGLIFTPINYGAHNYLPGPLPKVKMGAYETEYNDVDLRRVEEGYHSYVNLSEHPDMPSPYRYVLCKIPKGSKYYTGYISIPWATGEPDGYVSNNLEIIKVVN